MGAGQFISPALQEYSKIHGNRFVRALGNRLALGVEPACLLVQGDSTGNDGNEWVEYVTRWLADQYPTHTVYKPLWNHTYQTYDPFRRKGGATRVQTGSAGDAYATFIDAKCYIQVAHTATQAITGDIDIRVKIDPASWTPATSQILISKYGGTDPDRGWLVTLETTGKVKFFWCPDGTYAGQKTSTASAVVGVETGVPTWIRVTLDVDNDAGGCTVKFYKSTNYDGDYWTQIGDDKVIEETTALPDVNIPLELGNRSNGGSYRFIGKIYAACVLKGIEGECVASPNLDQAFPVGTTEFKDLQGNTVTVNENVVVGNGSPGLLVLNASCTGQKISYSADETRFALQTPIEPQLAFISYSHNEASTVDYQSTYEGLATQILTKYPNTGIVCVTQNPKAPPSSVANICYHAQRNLRIAALAAKNDYGLIDAYRIFMETGNPDSYSSDGTHPTEAGSVLWANEAIKFLQPAVK